MVETKQELGNLKDLRQKYLKVQHVNAKLTQSSAEFREQIRGLSAAVKTLEAQNAKQVKQIEDLTRKLERSTSEAERRTLDRNTSEEGVSPERRTLHSPVKRANDDDGRSSKGNTDWNPARKQWKWV